MTGLQYPDRRLTLTTHKHIIHSNTNRQHLGNLGVSRYEKNIKFITQKIMYIFFGSLGKDYIIKKGFLRFMINIKYISFAFGLIHSQFLMNKRYNFLFAFRIFKSYFEIKIKIDNKIFLIIPNAFCQEMTTGHRIKLT